MTISADTIDGQYDRKPWLARLADASTPYLYSAPSLILIAGVMLVPLVIGISYAFRDIVLLNPFSGGFIGLDHFRALSKDAAFYGALKNTLWWTGASVILQFIFGLILALLLEEVTFDIEHGGVRLRLRHLPDVTDALKTARFDECLAWRPQREALTTPRRTAGSLRAGPRSRPSCEAWRVLSSERVLDGTHYPTGQTPRPRRKSSRLPFATCATPTQNCSSSPRMSRNKRAPSSWGSKMRNN